MAFELVLDAHVVVVLIGLVEIDAVLHVSEGYPFYAYIDVCGDQLVRGYEFLHRARKLKPGDRWPRMGIARHWDIRVAFYAFETFN